jgi:hypothetical protein
VSRVQRVRAETATESTNFWRQRQRARPLTAPRLPMSLGAK